MIYTTQVFHKNITNEVLNLNNLGYTIVNSKIKENNILELTYRIKCENVRVPLDLKNREIYVIKSRRRLRKRRSQVVLDDKSVLLT